MRGITGMCIFALGACFSPDPPSGVPCSSNDECPDGQTCDVITHVCDGTAQPGEETWLDDTAADFTAAGAYLDEVAIEPGGFVGPIGSLTGGLRVAGLETAAFSDPDAITYDELAAMPIANTAVVRSINLDYGTGRPIGIVGNNDDVTVLVEGEIQLDAAGSWRFELTADDAGFLDIAAPGTDFVRLISSTQSTNIATLQVAAPGWYRIRGAVADALDTMEFRLRVDSPAVSGNGFRDLSSDELRARVDDLPGVVIDGFDEPFDVSYVGSSRSDTLEAIYGGSPFGIPVGNGASTVRTSGQLLIDTEGDYQFQIDTQEGHRMSLDGEVLVDRLGRTSNTSTTTDARHLVAGWHDVVVDVNNRGNSNSPRLDFAIATGPVTGAIASDHLRPVVGRGDRFATRDNTNALAIPDGGTITRTISLSDQPLDFVPTDIHLAIRVDHGDLSTVGVTVDPPVGATIELAAVGSLSGTSDVLRDGPPIDDAGTTWQFHATDSTVDMVTGTIEFAGVTMVGSGGVLPFATSYRYESAVRDLGPVIELGAMTWSLRQASDPSDAKVQIRTCDTPAACAAEAWTDVAFGTVPAVPLRQFAQYGITIPTDGDVPTALDAVQLKYTTLR